MDWEDLRHFTALVQEGSLSAAARRLGVEHATVGRRVAALEAASGVKLVDRRSGRYRLTPAGGRLAGIAERMAAEALAAERAMRSLRGPVETEISVSAPPAIASRIIAPRLTELAQAYPHLRVLLASDAREVSLVRGEADLAVRLSRPAGARLVARRIGSVTYRPYAACGYMQGRDNADVVFLGLDESLAGAPHERWMRRLAGDRRIGLRTNDLAVQCAAASAGLGVAVLPDFLAVNAGLVPVNLADRDDLAGGPVTRDIWLVWHEDLRNSADLHTVAEFIAGCVRRGADEQDAKPT